MRNSSHQSESFSSLMFGEIVRKQNRILWRLAHIIGIVVLTVFVYLVNENLSRALEFLVIGLVPWLAWEFWVRGTQKSLPYMPAFLLVQGIFYLMPLAVNNPGLEDYSSNTIAMAVLGVVVFFASVWAGNYLGNKLCRPWPSRFNIEFSKVGGAKAGMTLAIFLLSVNVCVYAAHIISGIQISAGTFSVLRSFADVAALGGLFFAGMNIARKEVGSHLKIMFWTLFILALMLYCSGLLLYSVFILVVAYALGLVVGGGGFPWKFFVCSFCLLAFLNYGKTTMREKYWDESGAASGTSLTLSSLPSFYLEWVNESLRLMGHGSIGSASIPQISNGSESGSSISKRIDEMDNLLFIVDIMEHHRIAPLHGATYTLIPPLLIPRIFWENKPIAHGGQVMLNLYFGRQQSIEETEKTFIAWGLYPEAVGNFGVWIGAIVVGMFIGITCGVAEKLSFAIRLFSIEGFLALIVFMHFSNSFGVVASLLCTTLFQSTCAVIIGGYLIYWWMANAAGGNTRSRRRMVRRGSAKPNPSRT